MSLKAKICAILFGMACAVSGAQAQDMKGTTEPMKPANWLFVQVADSVTVSDKTLTLKGVAPQTLMFADRPERMTGDTPTAEFAKFWNAGKDSFERDPPNATLSVTVDGKPVTAVVELTNPVLSGDTLTYTYRTLSDDKPATGTSASLFIDWWYARGGVCYRGPYGGLHCHP